jgi:hypothetical protein
MRSYRCFLLMHTAFAGVEIIKAETDAEAEERAETLVRDRGPRFNGYDLWDGTRHVQRVRDIPRERDDSLGANSASAFRFAPTADSGSR